MYNNNYRSNSSYNSNYRNNNYQQNSSSAPQFKKSGAKYSTITKGKNMGGTSISAWRKTKSGLIIAKCFPVSAEVYTSKTGKEFLRYAVDVSNSSMGTSKTYWCLYCLQTKKLVIKELGLVISPNGSGRTASGKSVTGYFGRNYRK